MENLLFANTRGISCSKKNVLRPFLNQILALVLTPARFNVTEN